MEYEIKTDSPGVSKEEIKSEVIESKEKEGVSPTQKNINHIANDRLSAQSKGLIDHYDANIKAFILRKSPDQPYHEFFQEKEAALVKLIEEVGEGTIGIAYTNQKGDTKIWQVSLEKKKGETRIHQVADRTLKKMEDKKKKKYTEKPEGAKNRVYPQKSYLFNLRKGKYVKVIENVQRYKREENKINESGEISPTSKPEINSMLAVNEKLINEFGHLPYPFVKVTKASFGSEIQEDAGVDLITWIEGIYNKGEESELANIDRYQDQIFKTCLDANCFLSQIGYCYGDQKFENICIKIGSDGKATVKIIDYGEGSFFNKEGKFLYDASGEESISGRYISFSDHMINPISHQTRDVPVTASFFIAYIAEKNGVPLLEHGVPLLEHNELNIREYLDLNKTKVKIEKFIAENDNEEGFVSKRDIEILKLALDILVSPPENRPTPEVFRQKYFDLIAKVPYLNIF